MGSSRAGKDQQWRRKPFCRMLREEKEGGLGRMTARESCRPTVLAL